MLVFITLLTGLTLLSSPGKPRVPVIRKLIQGDTNFITIRINYAESTTTKEIPPAPYPVRKGSKPKQVRKDMSVYKKDAFYPEKNYSFYYLGKRRKNPYWILEIHPYQYNPVKKKVRYATSAEIKRIQGRKTLKEENRDTLLIVGPKEFLSSLDYFIFYKKVCGFMVETLITQTSWETTRIRNEIISRLPDYLLLVGDISYIPAFQRIPYIPDTGEDPRWTDLYYACTDFDYVPDMFYGRLSVESLSELQNIIQKIINYDTLQADWKRKAFFMASNDIDQHTLVEEAQIYSMKKAREVEMIVDSNFAFYENPGTPLYDAFSNGRTIAAYSGHGVQYKWNGPYFDKSDIQNLPPNFKTPIIFSFACFTGSYDVNDCFMEEWNLAEEKGSVISFGSSASTYWEEDDILQRRIFDVLFTEKTIGAIIDTSKLLFARDYTGDSIFIKSYYQQYNLLGDPTLRVRYRKDKKTNLDIPMISSINDTITASLEGEGTIGLLQGDVERVIPVDYSGKVRIPLAGFSEGRVEVFARNENNLITQKTIHLSPRPLDEIFRVDKKITRGVFTIHFYAIPGKVKGRLYDVLGRVLDEKVWQCVTDGEEEKDWDIESLPRGIYFLETRQAHLWRFTEKIIKL
ncbi:MAG: C25 family cysteine peptidase [candidate division WOR-3 bacterium]|nr:C25 family cysteine peptidase [candidate division WOR-3 bacterium]